MSRFRSFIPVAIVLAIVAAVFFGAMWPSSATPPPEATPVVAVPTPSPFASPQPTATATPVVVESEPLTPPWEVERPPRDLADLAVRYGRLEAPPSILESRASPPALGHEEVFWVAGQSAGYSQIWAELAAISEHAYFYVEQGLPAPEAALQQSVADFEEVVYPGVTTYFGWPARLEAYDDSRVYVLISRLSGMAGYHSSVDSYPRSIHPYSNERPIIYASTNAGALGTQSFAGLLAHELQHLVRWYQQPIIDNWINEGCSELAVQVSGYRVRGTGAAFLSLPDTQLTAWATDPSRASAHYGAAYLFMSYFAERFGPGALPSLVRTEGRGTDLFDRFLAAAGHEQLRFDDVFVDWTVANYLDNPEVAGGRYGYRDLDVRTRAITQLGPVDSAIDTVSQYAARYYSLPTPASDMELVFKGSETVRLLPTSPYSGRYMWWGHRGDILNTRLTLDLDLTDLDQATLRFWTWFDIEAYYDYAYVAVSTDGGRTWTPLPGKHTSTANPTGNSLGHGYTGRSGGGTTPVWVQEEIDLSRFAGREMQLRFEYVTDDAVNGAGFAIDRIEIPELGFFDDAERDGDWLAEGFVRTDNVLPQRYALSLVREGPTPQVERFDPDSRQRAVIPLPASDTSEENLTLIVTAMAPLTTERATLAYSLRTLPAEAEESTPAAAAGR